jgi:hypothetical protein
LINTIMDVAKIKPRASKLNAGQYATMLTSCTIFIGITLLIIAWQEGWGSFSTKSPGPVTTRPGPVTTRPGPVTTRPGPVTTRPTGTCAQGMNPFTSQQIPCCVPEQACTWQSEEAPIFPDGPGTTNYGITAAQCSDYTGIGYYDGCWKENTFYPTNYPAGNLL